MTSNDKYLLIRSNASDRSGFSGCIDHTTEIFSSNVISHDFEDLKFWEKILDSHENITAVFIDCKPRDSNEFEQESLSYTNLLGLVLNKCKNTLKCLCIPDHGTSYFPNFDSLPELEHVCLQTTSKSNMRKLLETSPKLEVLTCSSATGFTEWNLLPKGFKELRYMCVNSSCGQFTGLSKIIRSLAAETIQEIQMFKMTDADADFDGDFMLTNLKRIMISVSGKNVEKQIVFLTRVIQKSPSLKDLTFIKTGNQEVSLETWTTFFDCCKNLHFFHFTSYPNKKLHYDLMNSVLDNMTQLKRSYIQFEDEEGVRISILVVKDVAALTSSYEMLLIFLESSFSGCLLFYELFIRDKDNELRVPVKFLEELDALSTKKNVEVYVEKVSDSDGDISLRKVRMWRQDNVERGILKKFLGCGRR